MLGIPNLNIVYEDERCRVFIHDIEGKGELLVMHAEVLPKLNKTLLNHYIEVVHTLFAELKKRGVKELEAWVNTDEEIHYAQHMGFDQFLGELYIHDQPVSPSVFRLKKRLN